jgi:hypothetical protein
VCVTSGGADALCLCRLRLVMHFVAM